MADGDVKTRIRKLLDEALEKHGPSIELTAIEDSWGDTLADDEMVEWLEAFIALGSGIERHDHEVEELSEIEDKFQDGITRH